MNFYKTSGHKVYLAVLVDYPYLLLPPPSPFFGEAQNNVHRIVLPTKNKIFRE